MRAPRGLGERLPVHLVVCEAGRCRPGDPWMLAVMGACAWGTSRQSGTQISLVLKRPQPVRHSPLAAYRSAGTRAP